MMLQHEETGRLLDWPESKPIPKGYARIPVILGVHMIGNVPLPGTETTRIAPCPATTADCAVCDTDDPRDCAKCSDVQKRIAVVGRCTLHGGRCRPQCHYIPHECGHNTANNSITGGGTPYRECTGSAGGH